MTTFISVLFSIGCFILVFKAIERDAHSVQNKATDKHDDIDFVTISEQIDHLNELKDNLQSIEDIVDVEKLEIIIKNSEKQTF